MNHVTKIEQERIRKRVLKKNLIKFFQLEKKKIIREHNGTNYDLYISDHFVDRIAERHLEGNIVVLKNMVWYFMETLYYGTKQDNKTYIIRIKDIGIAFSITEGTITETRQAVVKTVYDIDKDDWYCDEDIELKPSNLIK